MDIPVIFGVLTCLTLEQAHQARPAHVAAPPCVAPLIIRSAACGPRRRFAQPWGRLGHCGGGDGAAAQAQRRRQARRLSHAACAAVEQACGLACGRYTRNDRVFSLHGSRWHYFMPTHRLRQACTFEPQPHCVHAHLSLKRTVGQTPKILC
jgi:hypothetical protein